MGAQVIGGYLAHSLAILSDAAHLLSDVGGMLISIMVGSRRPVDVKASTIRSQLFFFKRAATRWCAGDHVGTTRHNTVVLVGVPSRRNRWGSYVRLADLGARLHRACVCWLRRASAPS